MKRKILLILLIAALLMSMCITNSSAKELDFSLAEVAALSKLEPIGGDLSLNAYSELEETSQRNLPSSYSSRDLGYTTPVRYQTSNICWAYSSLASLETLLLKSNIATDHLSPWHMNIWGTTESDGNGWQRTNLELDGGYSYIPMGYLTSWNGPLLDTQLPIDSSIDDYKNAQNLYSSQYGVTGIKYIDPETPIETVKSYIMDYGAVIANFNADTSQYMNATSDAFYCEDPNLPTRELHGHAVSVVGWDDNYSKENFSTSHSGDTPLNNGAWLIKNSWSDRINTNGGYFWISYEDAWMFHSIFGPSFTISDFEVFDGSQSIYQNEVYGATSHFHYLTDENFPTDAVTYINVFDFAEEDDLLDKVVFESTSYDADYTIYYIPVLGGKPTSEKTLWQKLAQGTVDYTGYIPVDIDDFDLPEGKGAIGITIDNTRTYNENKNNPGYEFIANDIGVCEWLGYNGGYYFKYQASQGESFVMYDEFGQTNVYDVMDFYDEFLNDSYGCTFVIKAITKNPDFIPDVTESQPATQTTATEPETTEESVLKLSVTMEYRGGNQINVVANTTGGSNDSQYQFAVNSFVVQGFSEKNYTSIEFENDGIYTITISSKSGGKIISTDTTVEVKNGEVVTPGSTEPTEPTSSTASATTATTETTTTTATIPSSSATQAAKSYMIGDVDYNGTIGIKDATIIRKYLAKMIEFDSLTYAISDVNDSKDCSIKDATLIQKYIALIDAKSNVGKMALFYN